MTTISKEALVFLTQILITELLQRKRLSGKMHD